MILKDVKIVNFNKTIDNADIEIKGDKISKITPKPGMGKRIVVPGFIDQHIHGFMGKDAMDGKEAVEFISQELAKQGTIGFLPTVMTEKEEVITKALNEVAQAEEKGAKILGIHLEGPFISIEKKGAHNQKYITKANQEILQQYIDASQNLIRKITIAPENFDIELIDFLIENNIIPSIGHTNASAEEISKYIQRGASSATHLWNAMSGVANRNAGAVEEVLNNESIISEIIFDLIHVDEKAIKLSLLAKGSENIIAVTDAIRPAGLPDGYSVSGGMEIEKKGALITLKNSSTIAGSGATMHHSFMNIVKLGYSLNDAVALTSFNPANMLGLEKNGEVKKGFFADLIVLENDLTINQILINGVIVK